MLTALILSLSLNLGLTGLSLFHLKNLREKDRAWVRESRRYADMISGLLDRLMHATGQTWTPPPRPVKDEELIDEELQKQLEGWREV